MSAEKVQDVLLRKASKPQQQRRWRNQGPLAPAGSASAKQSLAPSHMNTEPHIKGIFALLFITRYIMSVFEQQQQDTSREKRQGKIQTEETKRVSGLDSDSRIIM